MTVPNRPEWADDPVQLERWRYWVEHDPDAVSWPPPRSTPMCDEIKVTLRDRDDWNDHLANEVSIHILAVPRWLRRIYLWRVDRIREAAR